MDQQLPPIWSGFGCRRGVALNLVLCCAILLVGPAGGIAFAQEGTAAPAPAPPPPTDPLTVEALEQQLKEVAELPGRDEASKEELRAIYQDAINALKAAREFAARSAAFTQMVDTADEQLESVNFQLSALGSSVTIDVPSDASVSKLRELQAAEEKKLNEWKAEKQRLDTEVARRPSRLVEMPVRTDALKEILTKLQGELAAAKELSGPTADAQRLRLQARIKNAQAELESLQKEKAAYEQTSDLLRLQQDLAERQLSLAERRVALWNETVKRKRAEETNRQMEEARLEAARATGALRPLADHIREMAKQNSELVSKIEQVESQLRDTRVELEQVEEQVRTTKNKIDQVGLNNATGLLLRNEDASLPDVRRYRRRNREKQKTILDAQLGIIDLAEARSQVRDVDYAESLIQSVPVPPAGMTQQDFEETVRSLVDTELKMLTTLHRNQLDYFEKLVDLETAERQLLSVVAEYENYIDERVLWIKSSEALQPSDFRRGVDAVRWFLRPQNWPPVARALWSGVGIHFIPTLLAIALWLLLFACQPRLRRAITRLGEQARSGSCRSFAPTLLALLWTVAIALLWPGLLLGLAWRLAAAGPAETEFAKVIGFGLTAAGVHYLVFELLRQVCRTRGLADAHFNWPSGVRVTIRDNTRWFLALSVPLVFLAATFSSEDWGHFRDSAAMGRSTESVARILTAAALILSVAFVHRTFRPHGLLMRAMEVDYPEHAIYRYRLFWYLLAQFLPVMLLALTVIGYYYTARRLATCLLQTFFLIQVLVLGSAMLRRWLVIVRRRMAIAQAQQRRTMVSQQGEITQVIPTANVREPGPDLDAIGEQSRRLLQAAIVLLGALGVWWIWIEVIPALSFLERFELWTVTSNQELRTISVAHLVFALVVALGTFLATKNLPGLLELAVLARLPFNAGTRYALITICRYGITIIGVIVAFSIIGISWGSYQWLVAAAGVGLGFGLQEIFANFVSGLIVLFEQPIRVGDIVTIGDTTGVVSKIRMRATTVTNWDRQDFIVPNKEFITGRLLNWTLGNTINRVVITVGVAYGTDPNVVKQILLKIADDHPNVLSDPAPIVNFDNFGDSTLNIVLRCYLPDLENRLGTIHDLNTAAQRELNAVGIQFAFPTRELYFRADDTSAADPISATLAHVAANQDSA